MLHLLLREIYTLNAENARTLVTQYLTPPHLKTICNFFWDSRSINFYSLVQHWLCLSRDRSTHTCLSLAYYHVIVIISLASTVASLLWIFAGLADSVFRAKTYERWISRIYSRKSSWHSVCHEIADTPPIIRSACQCWHERCELSLTI